MTKVPETATTAQAARSIGVSVATVRRMVDRGELRPIAKAPGDRGAYIFDRADIVREAARRAAERAAKAAS